MQSLNVASSPRSMNLAVSACEERVHRSPGVVIRRGAVLSQKAHTSDETFPV